MGGAFFHLIDNMFMISDIDQRGRKDRPRIQLDNFSFSCMMVFSYTSDVIPTLWESFRMASEAVRPKSPLKKRKEKKIQLMD